jgi:hypothetical protein
MINPITPEGRDGSEKKPVWVTVVRVCPPDDIIIESLLRSQGIPYRTLSRPISQIPLTVGPFAEVIIQVPSQWEKDALALLTPADDDEDKPGAEPRDTP